VLVDRWAKAITLTNSEALGPAGRHKGGLRLFDLTYIVMDNQIYGLTTGQVSPTSTKGMKTKSTPQGSVENPINPIPLAMVGGATYVARAFSGKQKHMVEMLKGAIRHNGFALVDVFSPCVTYNKDNTYQFFRRGHFLRNGSGDYHEVGLTR
jgi:pyruvate/2-oxoacid:ferredoxin oxidoreductase beta subunit